MKHLSTRWRLIIGSLLVFLCSQCIYGALVFSSLYKEHRESILSTRGIACEYIARRLNWEIRMGFSLKKDTARLIRNYRPLSAENTVLAIDTAGHLFFSLAPLKGPVPLPKESKPLFRTVGEFTDGDTIWLTEPLRDKEGSLLGYLLVGVDEQTVLDATWADLQKSLHIFLLLAVFFLVVLAGLLVWLTRVPRENFRLRFYCCLFVPLILSQCIFMLFLRAPLMSGYEERVFSLGKELGSQLKFDLQRLVGLGLSIENLPAVDKDLAFLQKDLERIAGVGIFDQAGRLRSASNASKSLSPEEWEEHRRGTLVAESRILDVQHRGENISEAGTVVVLVSTSGKFTSLQELFFDMLTSMVVTVLFLMELLFLILLKARAEAEKKPLTDFPGFMRPVIFFCLYGMDLASSFVPIRIGEIGLELFGLPRELVQGLPTSCELFMVGMAILAGSIWTRNVGWRPVLLAGAGCASAGCFVSGIADDPLTFILARGLAGFGYGLSSLAAQVFVIAKSPVAERSTYLAFMYVGLYAGTLCGGAMGGLVAARLGYDAVFPVSAVLLAILFGALFVLLPKQQLVSEPEADLQEHASTGVLAAFCDRKMGGLLFLHILPCALVTVCLFQFFIPVSLNLAHTSPATIGRIFMLFCMIIMFLGPLCGKLFDRTASKATFLVAGQFFAVLSLAVLLVLDGLTGAVLAISLLAVCNALISSGQATFALSLPVASRLGREGTMGLYNLAMRTGQVLGPLTLGVAASIWDTKTGLTILCGGLGGCALLFLFLCGTNQNSEFR